MNMFVKVLLSLLATALAPLLLVTFVTYQSSQQTLLAVAGDSLEASAETLARSATLELDDAAKALESWSTLETMQLVFTGDDLYLRIGTLLRETQEHSDFIELWCTDATGKLVASSDFNRLGTTVARAEYVEELKDGEAYVGSIGPFVRTDDTSTRAIAIAYPIMAQFDSNTVIGAIVGYFDWDKACRRSALQSTPAPELGVQLYLADREGAVLCGRQDDAPLASLISNEIPRIIQRAGGNGGRFHTLSQTYLDGSRQILATVTVRGARTGLVLEGVAVAPEALVLKPARQLAGFTLMTCAVAAGGIFVLALILSRNISRPLTALSATAQKIADGDLELAPPHVSGVEIKRLAAGLNTMRLSLKHQIDTLDSSVRERTGQLEASVLQLQAEIGAREEAQRQASLREQQLRQADKMVSLGILVSGVAHEINNPNGLIALNLALIAEAWEKALPVLDTYYQEHGDFSLGPMNYSELRDQLPLMLADTVAGSDRIKAIVEDLKGFSRQSEERLDDEVDVNQVVQSSINLVSTHVKRATRDLIVELAPALPRVKGNGRRLEQVVINLLLNACDALEGMDDTIRVSTSLAANRLVVIEVTDTGRGIAEADLPRILDPFFTTRRAAGGTGLGLSVSAGIIAEHGGQLTFESEKGVGTTARISLPASGQGVEF